MSLIAAQTRVLLQEAKNQPFDDTPRLVLADWLMDQGDPRGELISVQMQRLGLADDDPRCIELRQRERQLLGLHIFDWLGPLVDLATRWEFRRGLIRIETRADRLLTDTCNLLPAADYLVWVEELCLSEVRPHHLTRLSHSVLLDHISGLDLSGNRFGDDGLVRLLESPRLVHLRALNLADNRIGQRGASALAGCEYLDNLLLLDLSHNRLGDGGALAIAESPHLGGLRRLDLRGNSINLEGLAALRTRFDERVRLGRRQGLAEG